jgi:hypothetical protein
MLTTANFPAGQTEFLENQFKPYSNRDDWLGAEAPQPKTPAHFQAARDFAKRLECDAFTAALTGAFADKRRAR